MRVAVLDWHQDADARARTFISASDAERLVKRLAAEEIRPGKTIRMFSPDSVFYALRPIAPQLRSIPAKLPPAEVENCKFVPPRTDRRPRLATLRTGWDWMHEPFPQELMVSA